MYKFSYAEIIDDAGSATRERERIAFDRALEMLRAAEIRGTASDEARAAISYVQKLWNFLIEDLANPENELAEQIRGDLISIGIWVIREADRVLNDPAKGFGPLIQVNTSVRDGLA